MRDMQFHLPYYLNVNVHGMCCMHIYIYMIRNTQSESHETLKLRVNDMYVYRNPEYIHIYMYSRKLLYDNNNNAICSL